MIPPLQTISRRLARWCALGAGGVVFATFFAGTLLFVRWTGSSEPALLIAFVTGAGMAIFASAFVASLIGLATADARTIPLRMAAGALPMALAPALASLITRSTYDVASWSRFLDQSTTYLLFSLLALAPSALLAVARSGRTR